MLQTIRETEASWGQITMANDSEIGRHLARFADQYKKIPRDATFPALTRPEGFDVYAHAYWLAADKLFRSFWTKDGGAPTPDYLVMPVLFLLHHYVELELKEVVRISSWIGAVENKDVGELPMTGTHTLTELLQIAEQNLKVICPEEAPLLSDSSKCIIEDLEDFGWGGEALKYPETTPKTGSRQTMTTGYVADVKAVMTALNEIRSRFGGCIGWLDNYQQSCLSGR